MQAFNLPELHSMFLQFYKEFNFKEKMSFSFEEMIKLFEYFARPDMLGLEIMKEIIS